MTTNNSWAWVVHNVIAHPLLVFWPKVGEWLHDVTASLMEEEPDTSEESTDAVGWAEKTPETIEIENVTQPMGNVVSIDSKRSSEDSIFDKLDREESSGFTVRTFKRLLFSVAQGVLC